MGQLALIRPEFTKKYLRAIEKCSLVPSMKVIELFAARIGVPVAQLLRTNVPHNMGSGLSSEKDLGAFEEDLNYQLNYITSLIKSGNLEEALTCIGWAETYVASAGPLTAKVSPGLVHRVPLLKGMAHLQSNNPGAALPERKKALALLGDAGEEKSAAVHDMLGAAYYLLERPEQAVQEHLISMRAVHNGSMSDPDQRSAVYFNLANAYVMLGDSRQALATYKEALPLLQDLDNPERKADTYNGMGKVYWDLGDISNSILSYSRARELYEEIGKPLRVAEVDLDMAELLIQAGRDENVEAMLKEASGIIGAPEHASDDLVQSNLHRTLALWAFKQGQLEQAEAYALISLDHGRKASTKADAACSAKSASYEGTEKKIMPGSACYPIRCYVEALQLAARIAEAQGLQPVADERLRTALKWAEKTGSTDTIHTVNMVFAESMEQRGSDLDAMEYYKAAAQANQSMNRKSTGPAVLVG
jgi:tetratricopeptide (TPR) repeat protein